VPATQKWVATQLLRITALDHRYQRQHHQQQQHQKQQQQRKQQQQQQQQHLMISRS